MNQLHHDQRSIFVTAKSLKFCYILILSLLVSCANSNKNNQSTEEMDETKVIEAEVSDTKTILCFGDSITAGYGLDDINDAYPAVIQSKIDSLQLDYQVVNSGLSGETSAGGLSRINWILNQDIDIFLLELGANDGLRGIPLSETRSNLENIIKAVQAKDANIIIVLAGMELPPNMGQDYISEFRTIFSDLAANYEFPFIPFILNGVGGIKELNQADGIHPTIAGHKIVADNVWQVLQPLL